MAQIKRISTELQLLDKLLDTSGDSGTSGQVLSSTGTGTNWINVTSGTVTTSSSGSTGFIPKFTSSTALADSILEVNSALPNDLIMPQYIRHTGDTNTYFGFYTNDTFIVTTSSNEAMRITSAGNVGIGTTSPSAKLQITTPFASSPSDSIFLYTSGSNIPGGGSEIIFGSSTSATTVNYNAKIAGVRSSLDNGSSDLWFQTTHVATATNPTTKMIIKSDGNVGIGTNSPDYKLEVQGVISSADASLQKATFANVGNDLVLTANADATNVTAKILFNSSGAGGGAVSTKMIIDGSGKVGIGTASPSANLYVSGSNANATDKATMISESVFTVKPVTLNSGNLSFAEVDSGNSIGMQFTNGAGTADWDISMQPFGGKVGIGTTSPTQTLDVDGAIITEDYRSASTFYLTSGDDWRFRSDTGSERMRITSAGNVGIGTTSPSNKLHVYGDSSHDVIARFEATGTGTGDYSEIHIANNNNNRLVLGSIGSNYSNSSWAGMRYVYSTVGDLALKAVASDGNVRIYAGGSAAERMRITSSGNVGIGTTSPVSNLHVKTSVDNNVAQGLVIERSANSDRGYINYNGGGFQFRSTVGDPIVFGETDSEHLRISPDGNVGIGTTAPYYKLDTRFANGDTSLSGGGDGNWGSNGIRVENTNNTSGSMSVLHLRNGDADIHITGIRRGTNDSDLGFFWEGTQKVLFENNGNATFAGTLNTVGLQVTADNNFYKETINSSAGGESWNASNGWHRIIEITGGTGRGKCHFLIQTGGGSGTPCRVEAIVNTAWSNANATLSILHSSYPNFITDIRVVRNTTTGKAFVDIKGGGEDYVDVTILPDGSTSAALVNFTNVNTLPTGDSKQIEKTITGKIMSLATGTGSNTSGNTPFQVGYDGSISSGNVSASSGTFSAFVYAEDEIHLTDAGTTRAKLLLNSSDRDNVELRAESLGSTMKFFTVGTEALELDASQNATFAGDVGIGTTPRAVGNTWRGFFVGSSAGIISRQAAAGTDAIFSNNFYINSSNVDKRITTGGASRMFINQDVMRFQRAASGSTDTTISWSESMRIDSSGNVGVGTTAPVSKLHVVDGDIRVTTSSSFSNLISSRAANPNAGGYNLGGLLFQAYAGMTNYTTGAAIYAYADGAAWTSNSVPSYLSFHTATSGSATTTEKMVIKESGNVGIGTTTPTAPLHIEGATNSEVLKIEADANPFIRWVENGTNVGFLQFLGDHAYLSNMSNGSFFFRTNNTTKMTIESGGNVGIGTTSPSSLLELENSPAAQTQSRMLHLDNNCTSNQGSGYIQIDSGQSAQAKTQIEQVSSGGHGLLGNKYLDTNIINRGLSGSAYGNINFATGSDASNTSIVMTIGGGSQKGNVGIGTTNPTSRLEIKATSATHKLVSINRPASDTAALYLGNDSASPANGVISSNYSDLIFGRDQSGTLSEWMRIKRDGNVGIGTTSPGEKLEVNTNASSAIMLRARYNSNYYTDYGSNQINFTGTNQNFDIKDNGNSRLFIKSGGNVGIGTTSPVQKLHIVSTDGANIILNSNTGAENSGIWMTEGAAASPYTNGAYIHYDGTNNALKINTGTTSLTTKLTIDRDTGNVGIGTTSPSSLLELENSPAAQTQSRMLHLDNNCTSNQGSGYIQIDSGQSAQAKTQIEQVSSGGHGLLGNKYLDTNIINRGLSGSAYGNINFATGSDASNTSIVMTIGGGSQKGNVGIGTTNPTSRLEIKATSATHKLVSINRPASDTAALYLGNDSASPANGVISSNYSDLIFGRDQSGTLSEWMRIKRDGNVGIGTTSPGEKLEVNTNASSAIMLRARYNSNYYTDYGSNQINFTGTNQNFDIKDNGNSRLFIKSGGNVGIGTTSPRGKLDIVGNTDNDADFLTIQDNDPSAGSHRPSVRFRSDTAQIGQIVGLDGSMRFSSGSTENSMIEILDNSNVGIGQATPLNSLDIYRATGDASIRIQANTAADSTILKFRNSNADADITVDYTTSNLARMVFTTDNSGGYVPVLSLEANRDTLMYGNVGIGTTSPGNFTGLTFTGKILDVDGLIQSRQGILQLGGSSYRKAALFTSTGTDAPYLDFRVASSGTSSNTTVRMNINSSGGIKFNTYGSGTFTGTAAYVLAVDNAGNIIETAVGSSGSSLPLGGGTMTGNTIHNDNVKSIYGTGEDLQIYHSGNNSLIQDSGTGNLFIDATNQITFRDYGSGEEMANFINDGAVELYYDNVKTFSTVSGGVTVHGTSATLNLLSGTNANSIINFGDPDDNNPGQIIYRHNGNSMSFDTADNERMRIDMNGNVGIGTTSPGVKLEVAHSDTGANYSDGVATFHNSTTSSMGNAAVLNVRNSYNAGFGGLIKFWTASIMSSVGNISFNSGRTAVNYNTSSDYRLKEDYKDFNALDLTSKIKVYDFKWKNVNDRSYGVIAHELDEIVPSVVSGDKDGEEMQSVDYSKLVPVLIKSIQELEARLAALEN